MAVLVFLSHAHAENSPAITFSVKPRLCVLAQPDEHCQDQLEIRWSAATNKALCLYQSNKRLPLRCWEDERSGRHLVEIKTAEDIDFQLKEIIDERLLVSQSFEVLREIKSFRKKRKNPWNFF